MNLYEAGLTTPQVNTDNDLVEELLKLTKINAVVEQLARGFGQQGRQAIAANSPQAATGDLDDLLEQFDDEFQKEIPYLLSTVRSLYRDTFSEDDITSILAFYKSEYGQRYVQGSARIELQIQAAAQTWFRGAVKAAFERAKFSGGNK